MKSKESTPLIQLKQVTKEYRSASKSFKALNQADLTIQSGEYVGILGKSGSGKTTLMNMITGIDRPTSGEILIDGAAIHQMSENQTAAWRNQHVGIVFQFFQLLPTLTVLENVMIPMDFSGKHPFSDKKKRAMSLLDRVGIADQAHKYPSALSGGQQQRVAIARALANDPSIILADEPTGNLDSHFAEIIFNTFDALVEEGKTVILVSHDAEIKKRISRAILITDGILTDDQHLVNTSPVNRREVAL